MDFTPERPQARFKKKVPSPDLQNFDHWLDQVVKRPFQGYGDKTNPDGTPYSFEQQLEASKEQLRIVFREWQALKIPKKVIRQQLRNAVKGLSASP